MAKFCQAPLARLGSTLKTQGRLWLKEIGLVPALVHLSLDCPLGANLTNDARLVLKKRLGNLKGAEMLENFFTRIERFKWTQQD